MTSSLTLSTEYQKKLNYAADLPVVDLGSASRKNWVPAELCDIEPGNAYRGKLTDKETAQMIRYACNPPKINADAIVGRGFPSLGFAPVAAPTNAFGISLESEMAVVPGREFNAPRLTYRAGNAKVQNGSWNILDVKFHRGGTVSSWWVLVVRDGRDILKGPNDPNLKGLVEGFREKLKKSGVIMPEGMPKLLPPAKCSSPQQDPGRVEALNNIRQILKEASKGAPKPSFILVLLENRDNFIYPGIKVIFIPSFTFFFSGRFDSRL
jgi:eukaryotic translation initiation factor 2C